MKKNIKKFLKIFGSILLVFIMIIIYISYITDHNGQVLENLTKKISKHYNMNEEITYSNEYGAYYIIKTKTKVIVLSKDYKEVAKEDLSKLKDSSSNRELIYKTNKLMYENTIRKNKKIIYEYYDAFTGKKLNSTTLEQQ